MQLIYADMQLMYVDMQITCIYMHIMSTWNTMGAARKYLWYGIKP
jgi:hypothetical protein